MKVISIFLSASLCLLGCTGGTSNVNKSSNSRNVHISLVSGALSCNSRAPQIIAIRDLSSWRAAKASRNSFPSEAAPAAATPDFSKAQYFLVSAGQRSTTGYRLVLTANTAPVSGNEVSLPIRLVAPASGSMNGMMMTNPCAMVKVDTGMTLKATVESLKLSST